MNGYQDVQFRGGIGTPRSSYTDTQFSSDSRPSRYSSGELRYGDSGPHREMAVDCPANFVGVRKEPPRLRRPVSSVIQDTPSGSPKGSFVSLTNPIGKNQRTPVSQNTTSTKPRNGTVDSVATSQSSNLTMIKSNFERDERDRSERLRRYQAELARKKELEDRASQQQELLRASLRGSKKMQDLEERKARARALQMSEGFDNPNYRMDYEETNEGRPLISSTSSGLQSKSPQVESNRSVTSPADIQLLGHMSKLFTFI